MSRRETTIETTPNFNMDLLSLVVTKTKPDLFRPIFDKDRDFYGLRPLKPLDLESVIVTSHERYRIENADFCNRYRVRLHTLVVVHSDPRNAAFRMAIRRTWGRDVITTGVRPLFFLGVAANRSANGAAAAEAAIYRDIVQACKYFSKNTMMINFP